jgi:hypothetical protein
MPAARRGLARLLGWLHSPAARPARPLGRQLPWRRVLPVAALGLLAAGLVVGARVGLPQEVDPIVPFVVGTSWGMDQALAEQGVSIASGPSEFGYDGQWFLGQAYDPLLRGEVAATFDAPRYRALRGLFPAAGWLLAAGQPAAIPYALLAVQLLAVGLATAAGARIASAYRRSRWWGLGFVAIPGVVVGVAYGTAEPGGLALVALGSTLLFDRRYGWAGLAFAGAALTKETYLAFAVAAAIYLAVDRYHAGERPLRPAAAVLAPGVAALAAWWGYVGLALPPDRAPDRVLRVFAEPLVGWWDALVSIARGAYPGHPADWVGGVVMVGTFGLLVVAIPLAVRGRRSVLAYGALVWGLYALTLSSLLLGRFLSAQRALAPAVLAAGLLLLSAGRLGRRRTRTPGEDRPPSLAGQHPPTRPPG